MRQALIVGIVCFLLGACALALAQVTLTINQYPTDSAPATTDLFLVWRNGAAGCSTAGGTHGANCTANMPVSNFLATPWVWTGSQSPTIQALTVTSGTISTPNFNTGNDFAVTITGCPCTLNNPSTTLVPGQTGVFEITQGTGGSQLIGTYGTEYYAATEPTLTTTAGALDLVPYRVTSAGKIAFFAPVLNVH